jgi:hypothetical protein
MRNGTELLLGEVLSGASFGCGSPETGPVKRTAGLKHDFFIELLLLVLVPVLDGRAHSAQKLLFVAWTSYSRRECWH